jgi:hypothetical protein
MKTNIKITTITLAVLLGFFLGSCRKKGCTDSNAINYNESAKKDDGSCIFEEPELEGSLSKVILSLDLEGQGIYPFHFIEDVTSGDADIADAQELLQTDGAILVASKGNYLYVNDYTGETFKKLEVTEEGALVEVGSVPNLGTNGNPLHAFIDNERVLITSKQFWPTDGVYSYQVINTSTMIEESTGTFNLPIQGGSNPDYSYMWVNEYVYFDGNVYLPFVEADANDAGLYDSAGVAVYNVNTLELVKTIYSTHTASLCNGFNPSYAISESGDLYMSSSNIATYGNNESMPSGIVRINSGETDFDPNYFFDFSTAIGNHTLGMLYVGSNRAIVQVTNSTLYESSDFYVEYYLVNLESKAVSKLNMPASKGSYYGGRRSMALLRNGKAAIVSNHSAGSSVYVYDPITNTTDVGINYTGADAIVGIKSY